MTMKRVVDYPRLYDSSKLASDQSADCEPLHTPEGIKFAGAGRQRDSVDLAPDGWAGDFTKEDEIIVAKNREVTEP